MSSPSGVSTRLMTFDKHSTIDQKKLLISKTIRELTMRRDKHKKILIKLKRINNALNVFSNVMNVVSVTGIVLTFSPASPIFLIVSLCSSGLSGITNACMTAYKLLDKISDHNRTYLQYSNIIRDINLKIKRNHLDSNGYDDIIEDLNTCISLIEDAESII
jgi:hypothetical protein